ncbi:MAG: hypothetical protein RL732_712 [Bacteroidota bacterium]
MKYLYISALFLSYAISGVAQKKNTTAYAITSSVKAQQAWTEVKKIDMVTGEVDKTIFDASIRNFEVYDAFSGKSLMVKKEVEGNMVDNGQLPFSSFAAACAYDKKHNRLYYTPMYLNQLRFFDLNAPAPQVYYYEGERLSSAENMKEAGNHITRMVIGADGNGYAISNDGEHFVRFSTGKNKEIVELGGLYDAASNTTSNISIHNQCSSWGGDMVGAADGSLYLISARQNVFKIDVSTREATFISHVTGLPPAFTTNGAVVDDEGNLVVSSATSDEGYYSVDMKTWKASKLTTGSTVYSTSDLANGNLAFNKETNLQNTTLFTRSESGKNSISIYPNPVSNGSFRINFNLQEAGKYQVQLVDMIGTSVLSREVNVSYPGQSLNIELGKHVAQGTYLLKVLSGNTRILQADKIVIN